MLKKIITLCIGICLAVLLAEAILHVFTPLPTRVKSRKIILPVKRRYSFSNDTIRSLDKKIIHTKNSIGFRGPELSDDAEERVKVICVGGRTTECLYLSDGEDWPAQLGMKLRSSDSRVWLNNAGLNGHSSFGHILLVRDYLVALKPDYLIFLVGADDIERTDFDNSDMWSVRGRYTSFRNIVWEHSEIVNIYMQLSRYLLARSKKVVHSSHDVLNADTLVLEDEVVQSHLSTHLNNFIPGYRERIQELIDICAANTITPLFLTQPLLYGDAVDPVTNTDLGKVKLCEAMNGYLLWRQMKLYNDVVRDVCKDNSVICIDLANEMPHSSRYFYDTYHFNNKGAEKVAEIVYKDIIESKIF